MRVVFSDDDKIILEKIRNYVVAYFKDRSHLTPEYDIYLSGDALLQSGKLHADIAFLDVEMPGIGGIHLGEILKKHNPFIKIFILTAYSDYLDEAMRFQVFRYLTKPVDKNRLYRNLHDAVQQYLADTKVFSIETADGLLSRRAEEIICVECINRKTTIYTTREIVEVKESIQTWKERLTLPCFYASHRNYIINFRFVNSIWHDTIILQHEEFQKEAYLSRRKFTEAKDAFLFYQEGAK